MSNSYYTHGSFPSTGAQATSASMRSELDLITAGFDKLPTLTSNANKFVVVNSLGTALIVTSTLPTATVTDSTFTVQDNLDTTKTFQFQASGITTGTQRIYTMPDATTTLVGIDVTQTLTNKTINSSSIGATTASTGAFTTLSANSTVSGTGFSTYLASPPAIGGTAAAAGSFTTLSASSTVSGTGFSTYLASPPAIGGTAPAAGAFTTLSSTGNTTFGDADTDTIVINGQFVTGTQLKSAKLAGNTLNLAAYDVDGAAYVQLVTLTAGNTPTLALTSTGVGTINNMSIGATTASTGAFTTVTATGDITIGSAAVTSRMFRALEIGGVGNNAGIAFGNNGAKGAIYGASGSNGLIIVGGTGGPISFGYASGDASLTANFLSLGVWSTVGLGIGATPSAGQSFVIGKTITGAITSYGALNNGTVQSDVTNAAIGYQTSLSTQAAAFTLTNLTHFAASQATIGATSVVTSQYGFIANSNLTGASFNYGFYGNIASGTNRYNLYMAGTADNYIAGKVGINVAPSTATTAQLQVTGGTTNATTLLTSYSQATVALVPKSSSGYSLAIASGAGDLPQLQVSTSGTAAGDLLMQPYGGSVGIGMASAPVTTSKLTVNGSISVVGSDSNFGAGGQRAFIDYTTNVVRLGAVSGGVATGTSVAIYVGNAGGSGFEAIRVDSGGNVGVGAGITSPSALLYVQSANTNALVINQILRNPNTGTGIAAIGFNASSVAEGDYTQAGIGLLRSVANGSGSLCFYNKGSGSASNFTTADEKLRIDVSGNVLIGTTTSPAGTKELVLGGDYIEGVVAIGNSGTAQTISLANGTLQTVTMTGNCTFTMPTAVAGKSFILIVSSGAGSFTGTFTSVKWPNNAAPTLTTTATRWDILTFVSNGTSWYGNFAQAYA